MPSFIQRIQHLDLQLRAAKVPAVLRRMPVAWSLDYQSFGYDPIPREIAEALVHNLEGILAAWSDDVR